MLLIIKKKNGEENMSIVQCQSEVPNHLHPNNLENWSLDSVLETSIMCKPTELGGVASGITTMALYEGGKYDPDNPIALTSYF